MEAHDEFFGPQVKRIDLKCYGDRSGFERTATLGIYRYKADGRFYFLDDSEMCMVGAYDTVVLATESAIRFGEAVNKYHDYHFTDEGDDWDAAEFEANKALSLKL